MRFRDREKARDLHALDRYISLHASWIFADPAPVETRRADTRPLGGAGHRWPAAALLIGGMAFVLAMMGQAGTERIAIPSLRGAPAGLAGESVWRGEIALELRWSSVREVSHYSVQVWDSRGGLIASRIVDGTNTTTTIGVSLDVPRPLLWTIVAWKETRRLAASEVLVTVFER